MIAVAKGIVMQSSCYPGGVQLHILRIDTNAYPAFDDTP